MYVVAVKGTSEWYLCKTDIEAAIKVTALLARFPQEQIILAEELELTVLSADVALVDMDEGDDHDCDCEY